MGRLCREELAHVGADLERVAHMHCLDLRGLGRHYIRFIQTYRDGEVVTS